MADLAKAYVQVIPSAEGISGNLSEIMGAEAKKAGESSGQKFSASLGGALGTGLKVAGGAAAVATTALTALGTSIVGNAKETAAFGDNIDKMSQKIGISAESFQEWDYVFSQNGANIGLMEGSMKKLAGTLADAQGGSEQAAEKFAALGLSLEDISGLSQEDLFGTVISALQEMPEGVERTAAASDLLGKSAMELGPLLNQSAADTEALKQQAHDLGMVISDDAVKASAGFTDAMDNMGRAMEGAKNTIVSSLLPGLTDIANGFANLVAGNEGATEQLKSGFEQLGQSLVSALPTIIDGFSSLVEAIAEIAPEIVGTLGDGILQALPTLTAIAPSLIDQLLTTLLELAPQLVQCGLSMIAELANGISSALPTLIPAAVSALMEIVATLTDPSNISLLVEAAISLIEGLAAGILDAIPILIEQLPVIIENVITSILESLPKLVACLVNLVTMIASHMPEIIQALIDAIPQIIDAVVVALSNGESVAALVMGFVQLFGAIVTNLPQIVASLAAAIPQIVQSIADGFVTLAPELVTVFTQAFDGLKPVFQKIGNFAKDAWAAVKNAFNSVKSYFSTKFTDAANAVKTAFNTVKEFFKQCWNDIKSTFSDALKQFGDIGKNIVDGLKKGIEGAWDSLKGWFSDKVGGLVGNIKDKLGIDSPSKIFADEVGRWIPAGIADGIQQGMGVLNDEVKKMTDQTLTGTITATTSSVNNVNYMPSSGAFMVQSGESQTLGLLARYLPLIAERANSTIEIKQDKQGTFNVVRDYNNKLKTATGYHALA